ncbi:MAG: YccF domain-containing protein [Bacillota bacterium]|nr:YccF domain-containing protein [Bacillota bacterium]
MITALLIFTFLIVFLIVSLCFHLAGGILKLAFKLLICLPCAILCGVLGLLFCCTLILIPLGIACFKLTGYLLCPFKACVI